MTKGFPTDEIRGRLLHEQLLAEARGQIERWADGRPDPCGMPPIGTIAVPEWDEIPAPRSAAVASTDEIPVVSRRLRLVSNQALLRGLAACVITGASLLADQFASAASFLPGIAA